MLWAQGRHGDMEIYMVSGLFLLVMPLNAFCSACIICFRFSSLDVFGGNVFPGFSPLYPVERISLN